MYRDDCPQRGTAREWLICLQFSKRNASGIAFHTSGVLAYRTRSFHKSKSVAMANNGFTKKPLFKVARELNVSKDRLVRFLNQHDYGGAVTGRGLNAAIADDEAYRLLMEEFGSGSLESRALQYLREALADESAAFRDGQWEAIRDVVRERKTLLLVRRTGWGKAWSISWPPAFCATRERVLHFSSRLCSR